MGKRKSEDYGARSSILIVKDYVNDPESYNKVDFLSKHHLTSTEFHAKVRYVRDNDLVLYLEYLKVDKKNKIKKFAIMESNLRQITSGILTGKCINGADFNIFDFYKLAPLKFTDFDREIASMIKDSQNIEEIPDLSAFKYIKSKHYRDGSVKEYNYAQNLIILAETLMSLERLSEVEVNALYEYVKKNNIRNITPACERAITEASKSNVLFDDKDSRKTFELMELMR